MFDIEQTIEYSDTWRVNGKLLFWKCSSGNIQFGLDYSRSTPSLSDAAEILGALIPSVTYSTARDNGYEFNRIGDVVFEKDGYQLHIQNPNKESLKFKVLKLKHNKKSKNAFNLIYGDDESRFVGYD